MVIFVLTQVCQSLHSDSTFYRAVRPATNLLMSADLGWVLVGALVISGDLWLFVVFVFLTWVFQKMHSDSRIYTAARPATSLLMSAPMPRFSVAGAPAA